MAPSAVIVLYTGTDAVKVPRLNGAGWNGDIGFESG
jgi:hypothetical protein